MTTIKFFSITLCLFLSQYVHAQQAMLLKEINPNGGSHPEIKLVHNGKYYFTADDGTHGRELWVSDGTAAGTQLLKDFIPGANAPVSVRLAPLGQNVIINTSISGNCSVWKTDGTIQGTTLLKEIPNNTEYYPGADQIIQLGNLVIFDAYDNINKAQIWRTDGTESGTFMLYQNGAGSSDQEPIGFTEWNNRIFYYHNDGNGFGMELWSTDGTLAGTKMVKDIAPGFASSSINNKRMASTPIGLFFTANDQVNGMELWVSDGTEAGTHLVKNINPSATSAGASLQSNWPPPRFAFWNGNFYFQGLAASNDIDLWRTDGTNAGTTRVTNIGNPSSDFTILQMTTLNNKLLIQASTAYGAELWTSDGTDAGTVMVKDIGFGIADGVLPSSPLTRMGSRIWFTGIESGTGAELWRTDGTEAGTVLVSDIFTGFNENSYPSQFGVLGNQLLFSANQGVGENYELFIITDPSVSGVSAPSNAPDFLCVFPNPTRDYFQISTRETSEEWTRLDLYSINGQLIQSWDLRNYSDLQFPLQEKNPGAYLVVLTGKSGILSRQILQLQP